MAEEDQKEPVLANKGLKDGRSFALGAFLKPRGSLLSEPNPLKELIDELFPPES